MTTLLIRMYFGAIAGLAAITTARWFTEAFPAPWFIEGLYRTLPLVFLFWGTDTLLLKCVRNFHFYDKVIGDLQFMEMDKPIFIESVGRIGDETVLAVRKVKKISEKGFSDLDPTVMKKTKERIPFQRGFVFLKPDARHPWKFTIEPYQMNPH